MKVVVTGANGFVGSSLIKKLIKYNFQIIAVDISFVNNHLPDSDLITQIENNLVNTEYLYNCIIECDLFYNLAWRGVNGIEKTDYSIQLNNIALSLKCAELAKRLNCKKYLCAGTIAERAIESLPNLESTSGGMMYGSAKYCNYIMLETYCKNIGLNFVWMQFSNIYGPNNKTGNLISYTLGQLIKGEVASFGPAKQPYDFIYVDDLIEAVYRLGIKKTTCHKYFIGSGGPQILSDYLITVGEIYGRQDLIHIGEREDDGIRYNFDMLSIDNLKKDIGDYISDTFENHIKYTIKNY